MYTKPVYSTDVQTDYTRVEPKHWYLNWKSWKSKSCQLGQRHIPHIRAPWAAPFAAKKPICFWESFSRISCDLWQKCPGLADKTCYVIFWPGTHWQWSPHLIHTMRVEIVTCTDCTDISCGLCMSLTPEPEPVSADVSSGGRGRCQ